VEVVFWKEEAHVSEEVGRGSDGKKEEEQFFSRGQSAKVEITCKTEGAGVLGRREW